MNPPLPAPRRAREPRTPCPRDRPGHSRQLRARPVHPQYRRDLAVPAQRRQPRRQNPGRPSHRPPRPPLRERNKALMLDGVVSSRDRYQCPQAPHAGRPQPPLPTGARGSSTLNSPAPNETAGGRATDTVMIDATRPKPYAIRDGNGRPVTVPPTEGRDLGRPARSRRPGHLRYRTSQEAQPDRADVRQARRSEAYRHTI